MEYDQAQSDSFPSGIDAPGEEANFHWQIARPDDEQLREAEICPEQHKREHQLAVIMNFFRLQQRSHGFVGKQNAFNQGHHAHRGKGVSDNENFFFKQKTAYEIALELKQVSRFQG